MTVHVKLGEDPREILGFENLTHKQREELRGEDVSILQIETDIYADHNSISEKIKVWSSQGISRGEGFFETAKHTIHATAVGSIMMDQTFGVAPDAKYQFVGSDTDDDGVRTSTSLKNTLDEIILENDSKYQLQKGDIINISFQLLVAVDDRSIYLPIDIDNDIREIINHLVTEMGLIVFIAAGNSSADLDDLEVFGDEDFTYSYTDLVENSKAIKVGYSNANFSESLESNFGSSIDISVPAESVLAACYHANTETRSTDLIDSISGGFCKSSASTPLISGLTACLQGYYKSVHNEGFEREYLIKLLATTSQKISINGKKLGYYPNIAKMIAEI